MTPEERRLLDEERRQEEEQAAAARAEAAKPAEPEAEEEPTEEKTPRQLRMEEQLGWFPGMKGPQRVLDMGAELLDKAGEVKEQIAGEGLTEYLAAPVAGVVDSVTDALNTMEGSEQNQAVYQKNYENAPDWAKPLMLEHYSLDSNGKYTGDFPSLPDFKRDGANALRDLSSIIIPTVGLGQGFTTAGRGFAARNPVTLSKSVQLGSRKLSMNWNISKDPLVKFVAESGVAGLAGITVDYTNLQSKTDHNFAGMLVKAWPKTWGDTFDTSPGGWATIDSDSEDIKRNKTIKEGFVFGIFGDMLFGTAKLLNALGKSTGWSTAIAPRSSKSAEFFNKLETENEVVGGLREDLAKAQQGDEIMDILDDVGEEVTRRAKSRDEALEELKNYNREQLFRSGNQAEKPLVGPHTELTDVVEQGTLNPNPRGVVDAMVGQARIDRNRGTWWGRLGTIVTEAALKMGLDARSLSQRDLIHAVKDTIQNSGEFDHFGHGIETTMEEINESGTKLAEILYDPLANRGFLVEILNDFKNVNEGIENLNNPAYNGVMKAIKSYMDDYLNMDLAKAQAYLLTSMGGEIADLAEGARLLDDATVYKRAQEQILDRMEYLMIEKGLAAYIRGASLNYLNTWKRFTAWATRKSPEEMTQMAREAQEKTDMALGNVINKSKTFVNELRHINENHPEYLKPMLMFYELSDGNLDTLYKMGHYVKNKLGVFKKGAVQLPGVADASIPSDILDGMWGIYYNSMLSSIVTVQKAAISNILLTMEKPIATLAGAVTMGDMDSVLLGWHKYNAVTESMMKGMKHLQFVFRKASANPRDVPYTITEDLVLKNEVDGEALGALAEAEALNGNDGIPCLVDLRNQLGALQADPRLRFGVNGLSAVDGYSRAMLANAEARGRAYMDMFRVGNQPMWNPEMYKEAAKKHYDEMFDQNGFITDKAVDYQTREMGMNLDNAIASGLNTMLNTVPLLRPFMMFSRTVLDLGSAMLARTPLGVFHSDYMEVVGVDLTRPNLARHIDDFDQSEIAAILEKRGIPVDENAMMRFKELRAEYRGRLALGNIITAVALKQIMDGKIHGDGHYDRQTQKVRDDAGWARRSFQDAGGNWWEFSEAGPWADWISGLANYADNFDLMSETQLENGFRKFAFVVGSAGIDGLPMMGLEPLFSIVSGDEGAWNRWLATSTSALYPWSGTRNDLSRIISPSLKEMDNELKQNIRNRNGWADIFDPEGALPPIYDYIDGGLVGVPDNLFVRLFNAMTPFKVTGAMSDRKQFLVDIEFDSRPSFIKGTDGIEYTNDERSELARLMGERGYFRDQIDRIMNTPKGKEFVREMKAFRKAGYTSKTHPKDKFGTVYAELVSALRTSIQLAEGGLENYDEILLRRAQLREQQDKLGAAEIPPDVQAILDEQQ